MSEQDKKSGHGEGSGQGGGQGDGGHGPKLFAFFIGNVRYTTDLPALTGAQIKARAPDVQPGDQLSLEGHGNDPDRLVEDTELVQLDSQHGPLRFTIVPKANFG